MSKNAAIQICLRVRPTKRQFEGFKVLKEQEKAEFFIAKDEEQGYVNNQKEKRLFKFNQIFDMETKQERIFDKVAKDVIDSAIDGFNGTIFAYGQTGSGKTFTMTGGTESYEDRGLIPRTLSYIFNQSRQRSEKIKVFISYVQIYNEAGYDLLQPQNPSKNLTDLPKVQPREGANGELHLRNLRVHPVDNQEDALNILFIGDTNRVVCKTPMNDQSTRSHCIFIIRLETEKPGSEIRSVASVHLVDLSGSERIKNTGVEGKLQQEAISINLGLHHLEKVIVALNERAKGVNIHVPYRDSLMTTILRDSIGGNCKTRMIATMSAEERDILESITTCKFAMRVALIKNDLVRNEEVDPGIIIERLKKQNAQLKAELALLKGGEVSEQLDKYEIEDCHKMVEQYIGTDDPSAAIILTDRLKINECFYHFKNLFKKGNYSAKKPDINNESVKMVKNAPEIRQQDGRSADEIKRLKLLVQQRDNEIALLLTLINKKRGDRDYSVPVQRKDQQEDLIRSVVKDKPMVFPTQEQSKSNRRQLSTKMVEDSSMNLDSTKRSVVQSQKTSLIKNASEKQQIQRMLVKPLNLNSQDLLDHAHAFEMFRRAYRKNQAMQQNQQIKQDKMMKGKELGKVVNQIREKINRLKQNLEQLKRKNAVNNLIEGKQQGDNPQQEQIRNEMTRLKDIYKANFEKLKSIKMEIENIDNLQKKNSEALERDFLKYITFKQKERENMAQNIDSSLLTSNIKDKEVNKHLQSFFKARDQIRRR